MKKTLGTALVSLGLTLFSFAAMDTSLTYHDSLLPAAGTTLLQTPVTMLAPVSTTNGVTAGSALVDLSAYPGTVLLVAGFGTGIHSTYTGTVTTVFSTDTGARTYTNTLTHTGTTAGGYQIVEIDTDTYQGTNAALYATSTFTVVCAGAADTPALAAAVVQYGAARAAAQTITGSAVDTVNYKGFGTIVVDVGAALAGSAAYTNVVTIQRAAASTGTWASVAAVTNSAADVDEIPYEFGKGGRYIRAVVTTTNDAGPVGVTINSFK